MLEIKMITEYILKFLTFLLKFARGIFYAIVSLILLLAITIFIPRLTFFSFAIVAISFLFKKIIIDSNKKPFKPSSNNRFTLVLIVKKLFYSIIIIVSLIFLPKLVVFSISVVSLSILCEDKIFISKTINEYQIDTSLDCIQPHQIPKHSQNHQPSLKKNITIVKRKKRKLKKIKKIQTFESTFVKTDEQKDEEMIPPEHNSIDEMQKLNELFDFYIQPYLELKHRTSYKKIELDDQQIQKEIEIEKLIKQPINNDSINFSKELFLNDIQRNNLEELYKHIQHFNQNFASNYDTSDYFDTAINLGRLYYRRNIIISDDKAFSNIVKHNKVLREVNKQWILFFVSLARKN